MHIQTFDKGFINTEHQDDYKKIYELDMNDEGYLNIINAKQFQQLLEAYT